MNLHRAIASITQSDQPEVVVFFEAHHNAPSPSAHVLNLLAQIWGVSTDRIELYNRNTERELLASWSVGLEQHGDARLLETGSGGEVLIHYARPEHTLFLVQPAMLQRLVLAQQKAAQIAQHIATADGHRELLLSWRLQAERGVLEGAAA